MVDRIIRQSPSEYINEPGILKHIPELLSEKELLNPIVVTDYTVEKIIRPFLPDHFLEETPIVYFKGDCTFEEIDRLTEIIADFDAIIAFGGGQLMDTVKIVSDRKQIFLINVQTVPSNCAAMTSKSIIYSSRNHEKVANKRMSKPVDMVLLEPEILRHAPYRYFLSGIGDTLAKYYEIRRRLTGTKAKQLTVSIGKFYIETCRNVMLSFDDFNHLSDLELQNVIDTIFLVAASVDGIADKDGRSVAAHAFHNAYVKVIKGRRPTHGEIVALGILFQLLLESDKNLELEVRHYYSRVGLPQSFADFGSIDSSQLDEMSHLLTEISDSRMQSIFPKISYQEVRDVLEKLRGQDEY